jgi:hypothetical protein
MNKKLGLLRRIQNKMTTESKLTFYKSLVIPHNDYCASIMFTHDDNAIKELQVIQNRFMRLILKAKFDTRTQAMMDELNLMSTKQRIGWNVIKLFSKMERQKVPPYLTERLTRRRLRQGGREVKSTKK